MFHKDTKKCEIKGFGLGRLHEKPVLTIKLRTHITEDELEDLGMKAGSLGAFGQKVTGPKALATHGLSIGMAMGEWVFEFSSPLAKPRVEVTGVTENDDGEMDVNYFFLFEVTTVLDEEKHRTPLWDLLCQHGMVVSVDFKEERQGDLFDDGEGGDGDGDGEE